METNRKFYDESPEMGKLRNQLRDAILLQDPKWRKIVQEINDLMKKEEEKEN